MDLLNGEGCYRAVYAKIEPAQALSGGGNGGTMLDFVARREGVEVRRAAELVVAWFAETEGEPKAKAADVMAKRPDTLKGRASPQPKVEAPPKVAPDPKVEAQGLGRGGGGLPDRDEGRRCR